MPFNMEPPNLGADDGGLFNSSAFDWQGGFGGLAELPPTGLTPRSGGEGLDTGQEGEGGQGLERLGEM